MKKVILNILFLILISCKTKEVTPLVESIDLSTISGIDANSTVSSTINYGTVTGTISLIYGDCMPGPVANENCLTKKFETWVFVSKPAYSYNVEYLIDSIKTDSQGFYKLKIPTGQYSLFINYEGNKNCAYGNNVACCPFQIGKDSLTLFNVTLNRASQ